MLSLVFKVVFFKVFITYSRLSRRWSLFVEYKRWTDFITGAPKLENLVKIVFCGFRRFSLGTVDLADIRHDNDGSVYKYRVWMWLTMLPFLQRLSDADVFLLLFLFVIC